MHKSSQSLSDSRVHRCSRERRGMLAEAEQSRCCGHKSSRERSRSRDARRDTYRRSSHRSTSNHNHYHRFSSRSRSNSPYRSIRQNDSKRRESSPAHDICAKNVPAELKLLTHDASYFLMKSNNFDNLLLAKAESVWSTPPQNEAHINIAFKVCKYSCSLSNLLLFCGPPHFHSTGMIMCVPSVLWRCWLGGRKGTRPVKNWVVGCWHGYLSGVRCRLAHNPADATAAHCLLLQ